MLSDFEKKEVLDYPAVYFAGGMGVKKIIGSGSDGDGNGGHSEEKNGAVKNNFGYDDEKARYCCVKRDHLAYRYEVLKGLGKGSFGDVVKCHDHKTNSTVAIKIIRNERRFHRQARFEIEILELLRKGDKRGTHGVIHMKDHFLFRNHICIVFEKMHSDLYCELKKRNFKGFSPTEIERFAWQLVNTLRVLRRNRIIHCDLKPENILLRAAGSTDIKVIDFGSSCFLYNKVHSYIQSRYYRSPEVILGLSYGMAIDIWSLGCILVELTTGQPIFPGHDEQEQLVFQTEVLGLPDSSLIQSSKYGYKYFDESGAPNMIKDSKGRVRTPGSVSLADAIGSSDPLFVHLISRCLMWNPEERISPRDASRHDFFLKGKSSSITVRRLP